MLKKYIALICILTIVVCSGCSAGIRLFDSKELTYLAITDSTIWVQYDDNKVLNEFVDRYYDVHLQSNILDAQDNGHNKIGEVLYTIKVTTKYDKDFYFQFCEYDNNGNQEYYLQSQIRGLYYISNALDIEDSNYMDELFYGDIIIID